MNPPCIFSPCKKYRYTLNRDASVFDRHLPHLDAAPVQQAGHLMFIGLNPSIADDRIDDNTIRICRGYARTWGYASMVMTNLYAYRETNAHAMFMVDEPVGPENDFYLMDVARGAGRIICCWGAWAMGLKRAREVLSMLEEYPLYVLKLNNDGSPHHPLRMEKVLQPTLWREEKKEAVA